jgi:threonine/homoserine/homoserine lactone efflux protein
MPDDREILRQSLVLMAVCVIGAVVVGPLLTTVFDTGSNMFLTGIYVSLGSYFFLNITRNRLSTG